MTRRFVRALALIASMLALASCSREVPLRIGPVASVMGLALLEVRVWNSSSCPADARAAADPRTLDQVAVARYFAGLRDAPAVGAVPAGSHAVSVIVRDVDCQVVLYGCTPNIDFATAPDVTITWERPDLPDPVFCETFACESGACFEPRGADASTRDGG